MLTVEEDKFDCFGVSVEETNVELSVMGVSDEEVSTWIFFISCISSDQVGCKFKVSVVHAFEFDHC